MRRRIAAALRRLGHQILHSDIALGYAAVLLVVFGVVTVIGGDTANKVIAWASTNLSNLSSHPVQALFFSAFVIDHPSQLLMLPVLMLIYGVAQHRLGRIPVLVAIVIGHLLATLFVAPLLVSGLTKGWLPQSITTVTDVGFSYGVSCVAGLLTCTVPRGQRRMIYVATLVVLIAHSIILGPPLRITRPTFTDMGHTIALLTGFGLASLPGAFDGLPLPRRSEPE